jgi:type IV secretory pathway component VirB8
MRLKKIDDDLKAVEKQKADAAKAVLDAEEAEKEKVRAAQRAEEEAAQVLFVVCCVFRLLSVVCCLLSVLLFITRGPPCTNSVTTV